MANKEHLEILKQGVEIWNKWRKDNPNIRPDLSNAELIRENLQGANFIFTNLSGANFYGARLDGVNLTAANLRNADLTVAVLLSVFFNETELEHTCMKGAAFGGSSFANVDLSTVVGLEDPYFMGPSSIGIDTLYKSSGKIPVEFLRGCGVPDDFITFIPSHFGVQEAIRFYSCFISYSTKDEEFARRLYSRMRDEKLRVWFAPEDMKGGKLIHEQIEQAIQVHDRLLVVLSKKSMASEWVKREIRNARRAEKKENRRKLFPIRLVDYKTIENWKGFEGDGGEDLAFELNKYYIPDFSNWKKDHDSFETEFKKLLRDLRAEERKA